MPLRNRTTFLLTIGAFFGLAAGVIWGQSAAQDQVARRDCRWRVVEMIAASDRQAISRAAALRFEDPARHVELCPALTADDGCLVRVAVALRELCEGMPSAH